MAGAAQIPTPKVIHIVGDLNHGAVETWLVRILRHAERTGHSLDWTFYSAFGREGALDAQARSLGANVVLAPASLDDQWQFGRSLRGELARGGYDVMHCHHDLVSGLYLASSMHLPIRRRIVHVHNADENVLTPNLAKARLYRPLLRHLCLGLADRIVGISNHTLDTFLAGRPRRPKRDVVHYYGVDPEPFEGEGPDRAAFRREVGVADDAVILLFGGRIVPEKNPTFAVDVFAELAHREPRAVAVFAGAGSEEGAVLARAKALGVADGTRMLGWRGDLARIMRCCDLFILPRPEHPMEGFGLAVVEAQLAGLRMLLSLGVPDDPLLPTACVQRIPLSAGASAWADAAADLMRGPVPSAAATLRGLAASAMQMDFALADLMTLHA